MESKKSSIEFSKKHFYGDRFVPVRAGNNWKEQTPLRPKSLGRGLSKNDTMEFLVSNSNDAKPPNNLYAQLLSNEIFQPGSGPEANLFNYRLPRVSNELAMITVRANPFSSETNQALMISRKRKRLVIPKQEVLLLTAPGIQDNFCYNLLDWSRKNIVVVGLNDEVYMQKAFSNEPSKACRLKGEPGSQIVTTVKWNEGGDLLGIGSSGCKAQIYDVNRQEAVNVLHVHADIVTSIAWHGSSMVTGDSSGFILQSDIRCPRTSSSVDRILKAHNQEVCNIKFSPDGLYLASSGGDGRVCIWSNAYDRNPIRVIEAHKSSVKALDWCPHDHGTLATGGGRGDTSLRIWNVLTGIQKFETVTGAQVCNLAWSPRESKLVTTHGFASNSVKVWQYPSLNMLSNLEGHECRVQYMAMSPAGEGIVTGGSDETVRFWKLFEGGIDRTIRVPSRLNMFKRIR